MLLSCGQSRNWGNDGERNFSHATLQQDSHGHFIGEKNNRLKSCWETKYIYFNVIAQFVNGKYLLMHDGESE